MTRIDGPMKLVMGCVVGVALLASACAGKGSTAAEPTTPPQTSSGGIGGYEGGYGGTSRGGSTSGGTAATLQQGTGGQLVFSPTRLTVKKSQAIEVKNVSSIAHTFTIQGKGIDLVNDGGQSQDVKITLAPGTYTFVCRFHVGSGMQGTLVVKG